MLHTVRVGYVLKEHDLPRPPRDSCHRGGAIAVLLAAGGAFYFSRNALINSLDGQLANTASPSSGPQRQPVIDGPQAYGDGLQIADASGSVVAGTGDKSLPVTAQVRAVAAALPRSSPR